MNNTTTGCCCHNAAKPAVADVAKTVTTKTAKAVPTVLLNVLIAFFPKCPMCWAVYMSMLGSIGIAKLPYMGWLLPVFVGILALHLGLQLRRVKRTGYLPFILSLAGAGVILLTRTWFGGEKWMLLCGMACVIAGSLYSSFSYKRLPTRAPAY
jgi:mercuric ion transport protein